MSDETVVGKERTIYIFSPPAVVLIAGAWIALQYHSDFQGTRGRELMLLSTASLVLLTGMSGLYAFAYKIYDDLFYAWLAVGWFANGVYIFFEGFYTEDLKLRVYIFLLAQVYSAAFYVASFIHPDQTVAVKQVLRGLGVWLSAILLNLYLGLRISSPRLLGHYTFIIATASGILFSAFSLWRTGRALKARLNAEVHGKFEAIFPWTFYFYAGIQPLYFFRAWPSLQFVLIAGFALGLAAKVVSAVCALVIVQRDFARIHEQQERVSMWEDLGVLAASLEHEIKNPLLVIQLDLDSFGEKYQANNDIKNRLRKLEQERQRIFAATEIVNNLRGGREYYERLMTKTSVGDVLRRSVKAVKDEMTADSIFFKVEGDEPLYTKAYPPVLQQVFVNLLKNSVEAIRQAARNSGLVRIVLKAPARQGRILTVSISDNGCGIPQANMPKIGHLFSTKRGQKPNSGIGLFISRRILGFHNGSLEMETQQGEGTTASVLLPVWGRE